MSGSSALDDRGRSTHGQSNSGHPKTGSGSASGSAFAGWIRCDSDGVIRGWATDRLDRSVRPTVTISINGAAIARVRADRVDPKLMELGEGDGAYAFSFVVPQGYRDGAIHIFEGHADSDPPFGLKSKSRELVLIEAAPSIVISHVGYGHASGRVLNARVGRTLALELWRDGHRLDTPLAVSWSEKRGQALFKISFPPDIFLGSERLVLAVPGMIEAGLPGAVLEPAEVLEASYDRHGALKLRVVGDIGELEGRALTIHLFEGDQPGPVLSSAFDPRWTWFEVVPPNTIHDPVLAVSAEGLGMLPLRLRPKSSPGRRRYAAEPFEIADAFLMLNRLYLMGACIQGQPQIELTRVGDVEVALQVEAVVTGGESAWSGNLRPFVGCVDIDDALYRRLSVSSEAGAVKTLGAQVHIGALCIRDEDAWAGRVTPWMEHLLSLCADESVDRSLLMGSGISGLTTGKPSHRAGSLETVIAAGESGFLMAGWAAGLGERPILLVDKRTLRHWDLAETAVTYRRRDVEEYLRDKKSAYAHADHGFAMLAPVGLSLGHLAVVAQTADGWAELFAVQPQGGNGGTGIKPEAVKGLVQTLMSAAPDRLGELLPLLVQRRCKESVDKPAQSSAEGPVAASKLPRLTIVQRVPRDLPRIIDALDLQGEAPDDVAWIIVDDRRTGGGALKTALSTREQTLVRQTQILRSPGAGLAASIGLGIAESRSEFILILDVGVYLHSLAPVIAAMAYLDRHSAIAACGFTQLFLDGALCRGELVSRRSGRFGGLHIVAQPGMGLPPPAGDENPSDADLVALGALLARRSDLVSTPLDNRYSTADYVGADLSRRLKAAGRRIALWRTGEVVRLEVSSAEDAADDSSMVMELLDSAVWTQAQSAGNLAACAS